MISPAFRLFVLTLVLAVLRSGQCSNSSPCQLQCKTPCNTSSIYSGLLRPEVHDSTNSALVIPTAATDAPAAHDTEQEPMSSLVKRVTEVAEEKALAATQELSPDRYPVATQSDGTWETVAAGHWMSGLFPGVMWQLYELTGGKQVWAEKAQQWQAGLANKQRQFASQHDFGFIYLPSFAHSYSVTNSTEDKRQALAAAEALSWAFVPATKSLRTFEGWKTPSSTDMYQQIVIIDFMINIQMLVWGAQHVGSPAKDLRMDPDPAATWLTMAQEHARQVAKNHVRPDGSTFHIVEYNPNTGSINKRYTYQGHAANSTWARGQAWAMAGFAMLYSATGQQEFGDTASKLTDTYLRRMSGQNGGRTAAAPEHDGFVPQWDFDAPWFDEFDGPRDTSAAGVAALGMLHLVEGRMQQQGGDADVCAHGYLQAAVATLRALASPKYLAGGADNIQFPALLKHATGGFPLRHHVDVGLISGDYYFLAALHKCAHMDVCMQLGDGRS
ncbi:Six-hairpin glycosidase-like protein [Scenedesmus sp. NREL 46B-D3]|nr:Six-hairpin glycosidase-like protein [Scenedesmus sp. NREL 46B-D3]